MIEKSWLIGPLIFGLLTAFISGRISLLEHRAGMTRWASSQANPIGAIVGIIAFPAQIAFLVAIFLVLPWYWGIGLLVVALFFFGTVVTLRNFPVLWRIRSLFDIATVSLAVIFWYGYFTR